MKCCDIMVYNKDKHVKRLESIVEEHKKRLKGYDKILEGLKEVKQIGFIGICQEDENGSLEIDLIKWNEEQEKSVKRLRKSEEKTYETHKKYLKWAKEGD